MSDLPTGSLRGSGASQGFTKRASKILGQNALYQLVEDMAVALDKHSVQLTDIHAMCTKILAKLT